MKSMVRVGIVLCLLVTLTGTLYVSAASENAVQVSPSNTTTPIKHLVVIFQENVSFDHYFGTYPNALNPSGEPVFNAANGTPSVNGLTDTLLNFNLNAAQPQRLDRAQALTCDQDHSYADEQKAFDHGLMDKFVESVSGGNCTNKNIVMNYYDGNTVTAMWNYAQHFAMSDNSYGTTFGPSTPGALNLISGQTHGATPTEIKNSVANGTVIGDRDPLYDDCSAGTTIAMSGKNVGDLLNAKSLSWGWFQGGFKPTATVNGKSVCGAAHQNIGGNTITDYSPHHAPFQYYQSTSNPGHLPPSSVAMIGKSDQANHQYDLSDFWAAANAGNLPAVSFLKAAQYQDGHAGYSDPLDEQHFLVDTINKLQQLPSWKDTAVIISYDDSDGWYDHVMGPIVNFSNDPNYDSLSGAGMCGVAKTGAYMDRCGYGPRLPLLAISPYAKSNFVDNAVTDQSSILRFIEDNWSLGRIGDQSFDEKAGSLLNMFNFSHPQANSPLILDPATGEPQTASTEPTCTHPASSQLSDYAVVKSTTGSSQGLANLIDNLDWTYWLGNNNPKALAVQVDYGTQLKTLSKISLFTQNPTKAPNVYFQYLDDAGHWSDIPGLSSVTDAGSSYGKHDYNVSNITSTKFRLVVENTTYLSDIGNFGDLVLCTSDASGKADAPQAPVAHQLSVESASASGGNASNLLDGYSWTDWNVSNNPTNATLDLDLGSVKTVTSFKYFSTAGSVANDVTIQYFNGTSYVTLADHVNMGNYGPYGLQNGPTFSAVKASKLRFIVNNGTHAWSIGGFGDVQVFGY